jgi:hypothetical protein
MLRLGGVMVVLPKSLPLTLEASLSDARPVGQGAWLSLPKMSQVATPLPRMVPLSSEPAVLGRASPLAPKGPRPSMGLWPRRLGSFSAGLPLHER